jgi:hypothetical protein
MFRFVILSLAVALATCAKPPEERRFLEWRLEDDLAIYRAQAATNPEHAYRVGELSDALHGPEYQRFLELVAKAPAGRRAFIYYEVSGANGIWFFALAVDGTPCRIVASDYDGGYERTCRGFSTFEPFVEDVRIPIRDPVVASLVQYEPGHAPIRTMTLGSVTREGVNPLNGNFIANIRRIFSRRHESTE